MTDDSRSQMTEADRIKEVYARRRKTAHDSWLLDPRTCLAVNDRTWHIINLLRRHPDHPPLREMKILEIGCGGGIWLRDLIQWGVSPENLIGTDILEDRIAAAKRLCPSSVQLFHGDAARLPLADACVDMVVQATVFSSILDFEIKRQVASEMLRVLKPGGFVLWSDFFVNNPRNPDVRGITKKEIAKLFPNCDLDLQRVCLAPPIGRIVARWSRTLYEWLDKLPFLRTHYVGLFQKL